MQLAPNCRIKLGFEIQLSYEVRVPDQISTCRLQLIPARCSPLLASSPVRNGYCTCWSTSEAETKVSTFGV
jgi:hypothetical protein